MEVRVRHHVGTGTVTLVEGWCYGSGWGCGHIGDEHQDVEEPQQPHDVEHAQHDARDVDVGHGPRDREHEEGDGDGEVELVNALLPPDLEGLDDEGAAELDGVSARERRG
eukprot:3776089-Prymnesium_polylepis.1